MKRFVYLLPVMICLSVFAVATTDAMAVLVPCCDNGFKPNKRCDVDSDCPNVCDGGFRDGKPCEDDGNCSAACVGGDKDGRKCSSDANCPGGFCGQPGTCKISNCTSLCEKKGPKSPSDPAASWQHLAESFADFAAPACP